MTPLLPHEPSLCPPHQIHADLLIPSSTSKCSWISPSGLLPGPAGASLVTGELHRLCSLQLLEKGYAITAVDNFHNSVPEALDRVHHIVGPVPDPPALTFGWIEEDALVLVLLLHRFSFSPVSGMVLFFSAIGVVVAVAIAAAVVVGEVQPLPDLPGQQLLHHISAAAAAVFLLHDLHLLLELAPLLLRMRAGLLHHLHHPSPSFPAARLG
ncbi:hypothetical protein ZWY2020_054884 [Hordeum vulgare]|nr:hypothetical protein ZWY2020_054884 [Hordeum vulgare]